MKTISLFLFFMLFYEKGYSQNTSDTIFWKPDYKLKWEDFQGTPDSNTQNIVALSYCFFSYNYRFTNENCRFITRSYFCKKKSWFHSGHVNINTLNHEQGHFNICELFARKLLIALNKMVIDKKTAKVTTQKICDEIEKQRELVDNDYDTETAFSTNRAKQKEWDNKIQQWLKETAY